jgi:hypothetical protein
VGCNSGLYFYRRRCERLLVVDCSAAVYTSSPLICSRRVPDSAMTRGDLGRAEGGEVERPQPPSSLCALSWMAITELQCFLSSLALSGLNFTDFAHYDKFFMNDSIITLSQAGSFQGPIDVSECMAAHRTPDHHGCPAVSIYRWPGVRSHAL